MLKTPVEPRLPKPSFNSHTERSSSLENEKPTLAERQESWRNLKGVSRQSRSQVPTEASRSKTDKNKEQIQKIFFQDTHQMANSVKGRPYQTTSFMEKEKGGLTDCNPAPGNLRFHLEKSKSKGANLQIPAPKPQFVAPRQIPSSNSQLTTFRTHKGLEPKACQSYHGTSKGFQLTLAVRQGRQLQDHSEAEDRWSEQGLRRVLN